MMELEIIAIVLSAAGVFLAAIGIIITGYWMSKTIRSLQEVAKAIHDEIKAGQEKLERKIKEK